MINPNPIRTTLFGLLVTVLGAMLAWVFLGAPATGIDDADIFFVYARNFSEGHGFVYNVGGEVVEGFTSLLWTLLCAGIAFVFQSFETPLFILNMIFGAITVGVCLRRTGNPIVFVLMLAAAPAWFAWCQVTLMESGLWCMIITLLVLAVTEQRRNAVLVLLPLLMITRPESMLWGAWILLIYALGKNWKASILPTMVFGLSLLGLVGFRLWYFGHPVPNTYYAKVSTNLFSNIWSGVVYFGSYLTSSVFVVIALVLWIIVLKRGIARGMSGMTPAVRIALCLLPGLGIPVLVGGDHFGAARFYQPIWPLLCLLASNEWNDCLDGLGQRAKNIILGVFLFFSWVLFPFTANLEHEFRIAEQGRNAGAGLEQMFLDLDAWPTVAVITAGGSKLAYPGTVHDLMGLNATEMAHAPGSRSGYKNHSAFNRDVFYRWNPDIVLPGDSLEFDSMVLNGLYDEPRFSALYSKSILHRNGAVVEAYYRNNFLMQLPTLGTQADL
jgi:hypothetical protein